MVGYVPTVTRRAGALVLLLLTTACSSDGGDTDDAVVTTTTEATTTSTSPPRPTTTTSLVYAPGTVEAEVEAAYLRSWEVYSEAVYTLVLDEEALANSFGGDHLATVRDEIMERIEQGRAARFSMEHRYTIDTSQPPFAVVFDRQVNHQVLVDPATKEPIEADPNELIERTVVLQMDNNIWRVIRIARAS